MAENVNLNAAEYNAFGPWVYEIDAAHPLPRLFASCFTANDDAILKIKIPREIDRRNASPGMDLYDFVIALYEDKLRILKREGSEVKKHLITAEEFLGVRLYENLLKGGCTVFSEGGAVSFRYNAISRDLIRKFMDLAIEKLRDKGSAGHVYNTSMLPVTKTIPEAVFLNNMLHDIQLETPGISVGAVQKSADIHRKGATLDSIAHLLWKEMNPEALHLFTDKDLIVVENGFFPNRVGMQEFGYTYTVIPFGRIGGIEIARSKEYSLLRECILSLGPDRIAYHFELENEEVAEFYNALNELKEI